MPSRKIFTMPNARINQIVLVLQSLGDSNAVYLPAPMERGIVFHHVEPNGILVADCIAHAVVSV